MAQRHTASRGEDSDSRDPNIFYAFAPWIIFSVVASPSTWEYAALAALIAALVLAAPDFRRGRWKVLDLAGIVFFAVLAVLALVLDREQLAWLEEYTQVISSGVIAVVALGSLAFDPFTAQYARESTPPEAWESPVFKRINRVLTAIWGAVFAAIAVMGAVALHVPAGRDWLNWVIPIALIVGAVKFTGWYPARVGAKSAARVGPQ
jgi:hypothetical protein